MIINKLLSLIPTGLPLLILSGPLRFRWWISGSAAGENKGLSVLLNMAEPKQLQLITDISKGKKVVFDIGANVGLYSLALSLHAKKVFSFEPVPRNVAYLYHNLRLNKVNNVFIAPCAIGSKSKLTLFEEGTNTATGKVSEEGIQPVFVVALDDFCSTFKVLPELLKIDIEGAEYDLLLGAKKSLVLLPPLFISYHSPELEKKCTLLLKSYGYKHFLRIEEISSEQSGEFFIT